ncbi:MAG: hypothetical protein WBQ34_01230 [Candidatus Acidiferrales bacterium]
MNRALLIARRAAAVASLAACIAWSSAFAFGAGGGTGSAGFESDHGKFKIMVNGAQAGEETFDLHPDGANWVAHGVADIQTPAGMARVTGNLVLHPNGTPVRYDWSTQGAKKAAATITFNGPVAMIDLHVAGKQPYTQQFTFASPNIAILDNNMYDQFGVLARLYNWQTKGEQTFPVLIPQALTPGSVTVDSLGEQDSDGKKLEELRVKTADLEVDLYLDGKKLVRIVSPSADAEIVRE